MSLTGPGATREADATRRPRVGFRNAAPKLSTVMSLVFVCLSIPILIFILLYNYHRTVHHDLRDSS
jgi:hypothetical protein